MNERIKELALQAMTYVTHNPKANKLNSGDMFDEKFAELIIQECKQAIKHEQDYLFDDGQYELSSHFSYLKERIDEHFGVEE